LSKTSQWKDLIGLFLADYATDKNFDKHGSFVSCFLYSEPHECSRYAA